MKQTSVMIVEDSPVISIFLEHIINSDPRLRVVASVRSGEDALKVLPDVLPDVISLDIRLPGMNGLEATRRIMAEHPTPIVVVSSNVEDDELKISMNALRTGALAVVQKPVGLTHADYEDLAANLCTRLFIMSQVRVIRQRYRPQVTVPDGSRPIIEPGGYLQSEPRILGIVASTGGPSALVRVLGDLAPQLNVPVVVVQHITPGFVRGFVSWLDDVLPSLKVEEARHHTVMEAGHVYVAPADSHTVCIEGNLLALQDSPPFCAQKPSGTILFRSMSRVYKAHGVGVLLTGMGEDGALGLKEMCETGAYTVAEHESSAVVYGMPGTAVRMGAARAVLPVSEIGARLNLLFQRKADRHV
ncbi:MAG: chemotaxis protein CheB [Verrucomicrobium sp.]|nr:chemotaxis protein CheB [Verrucomicrobium sp.]